MRRDRKQEIVDAAVREVGQTLTPGPSPTGRGENGVAAGAVSGESIQDGQGRLKWMWGVSVFSDDTSSGDVFSDE
jgi:hypothetical protein